MEVICGRSLPLSIPPSFSISLKRCIDCSISISLCINPSPFVAWLSNDPVGAWLAWKLLCLWNNRSMFSEGWDHCLGNLQIFLSKLSAWCRQSVYLKNRILWTSYSKRGSVSICVLMVTPLGVGGWEKTGRLLSCPAAFASTWVCLLAPSKGLITKCPLCWNRDLCGWDNEWIKPSIQFPQPYSPRGRQQLYQWY